MKVARLIIIFILAVFLIPNGTESGRTAVTGKLPRFSTSFISILHPATETGAKEYTYKTTVNRFKRRPVGINDYSYFPCAVPVISLKYKFIYVQHTTGYLPDSYHSVHVPLRSWRGPPTA
ncbi:hypothetical protein CLV59_106391 [Chitinophaga dinghuensis]|uniref:Uncharacterized protein n=1 Tax=Chitinophaga dinghuensis TaxID=1539050 RepID=A0A327VVT3_9BACT|nr:hypothetical protein [Chitinophaga dinghuensis]RAJ79330.1 hypothetical protein CLV59_106391 [Chitinophaga dinghuensis]